MTTKGDLHTTVMISYTFLLLLSFIGTSVSSSIGNNVTTTTITPQRVLLIGFGPSGMFFCHALEKQRQKLLKEKNLSELGRLPIVSAFERSSTHGGVWRQRENKEIDDTAMYEGLWANGAKELAELYDYTYDEHFNCTLPTYIQRGTLLDYMNARVTKNCTNFFEKYVTFNTNVNQVIYDNATKTFTATMEDLLSGHSFSDTYDKVIWAAGVNTIPFIPSNIMEDLTAFQGKIIHSSDVSTLEEDIKGKSILLIGGATSAEDLALTSIKLGVEKVHITFRNDNNGVTASKQWPLNKVQLYSGYIPHGIDDDGCVEIEEVDPVTLHQYEDDEEEDCDDDETCTNRENTDRVICGIDTIIFCTGYKADFSMLHPSVHNGDQNINIYQGSNIQMPSDWKMKPNVLSQYINENNAIQPSNDIKYFDKHTNLYRYSISINNPNMMYMIPNAVSLDQILWADVLANQALYYIQYPDSLPKTKAEMVAWQYQKINDAMHLPMMRMEMDENYLRLLDSYSNNTNVKDELENDYEVYDFHFRSLAEITHDIKYPLDIGSYEGLNDIGKQLVEFDMHDRNFCHPNKTNSSMCSFRDLDDYDLSFIASVHTGTKPVPFKKSWMELDDFADYQTLCKENKDEVVLKSDDQCISCSVNDLL